MGLPQLTQPQIEKIAQVLGDTEKGLRTVLESVHRLYPEQAANISGLILQIDEIENNPLELYLCDGTKRNLHLRLQIFSPYTLSIFLPVTG